jgi:hypothetical protein
MDEIKAKCQHKKNLSRNSIDSEFKNCYNSFCRRLTKAIIEAKKKWHNKHMLASKQ